MLTGLDRATCCALYLTLPNGTFWQQLEALTGQTFPFIPEKESIEQLGYRWLLPLPDIRRLIQRYGTEVKSTQALATLAQGHFPQEHLRVLVYEDLRLQLYRQGVFGVDLFSLTDLTFGPKTSRKYHIYRTERHTLRLPGPFQLPWFRLKLRLQAYDLLTKLEFCYFQQILPEKYRQRLVDTYPGLPKLTLPLTSLNRIFWYPTETEKEREWISLLWQSSRSLLVSTPTTNFTCGEVDELIRIFREGGIDQCLVGEE